MTARFPIRRFVDGVRVEQDDVLAVEEPLEIRLAYTQAGTPVSRSISVTMRTPGDDFELAAGFLFTEGVIRDRRDLREISYCSGDEPQEYNLVEARLSSSAVFDPATLERNFFMTSSCGVCGKASLDAISVRGCSPIAEGHLRVTPEIIGSIPQRLRSAQPVFEKTGGLHAAALFTAEGKLLELREDVGRHNAVDKLIGHLFMAGKLPLPEGILSVSGRASFELVQKAVMAGIPVMVAVGAPSSLAVELARRFNMTLIGFTRQNSFNVYSGGARIDEASSA